MSWLEDERSINYSYGKMNELLTVTDPEGKTTTFEYDTLGREMTKNLPNGVVTQTSYDPAGRITSIKNGASQRWGWGNNKTLKSFAYLYNEAGQRTYQIEETGQITAYEYDGAGRMTYPVNSRHECFMQPPFSYNIFQQILMVQHCLLPNGDVFGYKKSQCILE